MLGKISRSVFSRVNLAGLAVTAQPRDPERKVLDNFLDGDRLLQIPVSYKKRLVVLKWLAGFFEPGISYTEAQVNAILELHHRDCAIRREMIGCAILIREKGIYRRGPESRWRTEAK